MIHLFKPIGSAIFALICACALIISSLSADVRYKLTEIEGPEGYPITLAKALNENGDVVGAALMPLERQAHAFLYSAGSITDLGGLTDHFSMAKGINKEKVVVGRSPIETPKTAKDSKKSDSESTDEEGSESEADAPKDPEESEESTAEGEGGEDEEGEKKLKTKLTMRAFIWLKDEGMHELVGLTSKGFCSASSINEAGDIVGTSDAPGGGRHAVIWELDKPLKDLGTLGGHFSNAVAVSEKKHVVGRAGLKNGESHAFLWTAETGMLDLGALDGTLSGARGLNNHDDVVGYVSDADGKIGAFIWNDDDGMIRLGALSEGDFSIANSVNDQRVVVGISKGKAYHRAFIWDKDNGMRDLHSLIDPELEWRLHYAVAINNKGQIIGVGQHGGHYRAFLLTPIEEPPPEPEPPEMLEEPLPEGKVSPVDFGCPS